jgi:outer membrane immunogenic protein
MMLRLFLISTTLAALVGEASAADLPATTPAEIVVANPVVHDWTGIYGGVHAGRGWSETDLFAPAVGFAAEQDAEGGLAGGQFGYDRQIGNFVIGLQTDFAWSGVEADEPGGGEPDRLHWFGTTTLRLGYAIERLLVYGKGGVSYGRASGYNGPLDDEVTETHVGWAVGGGIEYAISRHMSVFAEYNHLDLGEQDYVFPTLPGLVEVDMTLQTIKAGANYRF